MNAPSNEAPDVLVASPAVNESEPLVSIIIPCYNTAAYVDDCIASAVEQAHANLEIIVIDDGSTDESTEIVKEWARRDERITVIVQPNRGLGAARNAGVAHSNGKYLTFLDSDDMLYPGSVRRMVRSAEATGSDFVTGVARRFDTTRSWRASLYLEPFEKNRRRVHLFEQPLLVHDHIICAKLFRRAFWDRHGLEFPEGTLFEDIELATRAHCLAESVDILSKAVYRWRRRPKGDPSITQDRTRPGGVSARFQALTTVERYLGEHAPEQVRRQHVRKLFEIDLPMYSRLLEMGGPDYRREFVDGAGELARAMSLELVRGHSPLRRALHRNLAVGDARGVRGCALLMRKTPPRTVGSVMTGFALLPMREKLTLGNVGMRAVVGRVARRISSRRSFAGRAP